MVCEKLKAGLKYPPVFFNFISMSDCCCTGGGKCPCSYVKVVVLGVTALLLLLVNLGALTGDLAVFVMKWWPASFVLYALMGLCPGCGCKK